MMQTSRHPVLFLLDIIKPLTLRHMNRFKVRLLGELFGPREKRENAKTPLQIQTGVPATQAPLF